jgi:hypothetical protein
MSAVRQMTSTDEFGKWMVLLAIAVAIALFLATRIVGADGLSRLW